MTIKITHFFFAADDNGKAIIYSIDVTTGNIIDTFTANFSNAEDKDNVIQYRYDNSVGILYALHWEAHTVKDTTSDTDTIPHTDSTGNPSHHFFTIYPNPFSESAKIQFDKMYHEVFVILYSEVGQILRIQKQNNISSMGIKRGNLASAPYYFKIICDKVFLGSGKILIE